MSGHAVVHRAPGISLKAHVLAAHAASLQQWRGREKREAIAVMLLGGRRVWVSEDEARLGRRRSLIDDNPAAG
ncbi:hypothetical protein DFR50_13056 [Roseiarcus fermentans]|uniref:Uncharacterized protein n=1 Tax=Roseiarcus fermentans TaxID=1473586 RepID=A0A366EYB8_9HYPH|nr:hypothetical protein [Roseiarcus fermentans]RBP06499.1 hypothetical protein DFR50_13056 [Roseiarcus fermentans]